MKCLILAAGYATRLYPLTENFPKPLLPLNGKAILDWIVDDIAETGLIDEFILISNHKYYVHFEKWAAEQPYRVSLIDDGTMSNETRLGAVRDMDLAIRKLGIDDDLLVVAGDNLIDFSMESFIRYGLEKKTSCIMRYYEKERSVLQKCAVMSIDENSRVLSMVEKPAEPQTHWGCPPFYYYIREDLKYIAEGVEGGCATDAPGSFAAWLSDRVPVHAMEMPGNRYDIGDIESYESVKKTFKGMINK